jgi:hypothetical protein
MAINSLLKVYKVFKYRFNSCLNNLELMYQFFINKEYAELSIFVSYNSKPIEKFFEFHIFDENDNFVTKIITSNPFFFV